MNNDLINEITASPISANPITTEKRNLVVVDIPPADSYLLYALKCKEYTEKAQKWAEGPESPDGKEDADSPTGNTMSAKEWALYAKVLIQQIDPDKIVTGVTLTNGSLTVEKGDGTSNSFDVVTSVNGMKPKNGNVDVAGIPVGFEFFTFNPTVQAGVLQYLGGEYSRETYKDLWKWVQTQPDYLISESEWQEKAAANNGNVPFYSTGDGSTTFRVPSIKCWVKGANETGEIGKYLPAGMPDITGKIYGENVINGNTMAEGAFVAESGTGYASNSFSGDRKTTVTFDARRSSSVYGNADTVQPESIVGVWCVKAFDTVSNIGNQDVAEVTEEQNKAAAVVKKAELKNEASVMMLSVLAGSSLEAVQADYNAKIEQIPNNLAVYIPEVFPLWSGAGVKYEKGKRVQYNGVLYEVVKEHVSQENWKPDITPSEYAKVISSINGEIPEWEQPLPTNAYKLGDRVKHNGRYYESTYDGANVWEPGVVGEEYWKDITDEIGEAS